jgi:murein DD-endopeptidase MepM/ murein hydrolase activator NlpD
MMAARGTPVVAIEGGTVATGTSDLGGITIWLRGSSGDSFYYAHLDGYVDGLSYGQSVAAGERIAYVGSTGNASEAYPHLHFEYHPNGGSAVNPTPLVAGLC